MLQLLINGSPRRNGNRKRLTFSCFCPTLKCRLTATFGQSLAISLRRPDCRSRGSTNRNRGTRSVRQR